MRTIKFRGYCHDGKNSGWVYGLLTGEGKLPSGFEYGHIETAMCPRESIGQFTGLLDKEGKEIFEGDIVKTEPYKGHERKHQVVYVRASFVLKWITPDDDVRISLQDEFEMEIIGNIYENPDLLK